MREGRSYSCPSPSPGCCQAGTAVQSLTRVHHGQDFGGRRLVRRAVGGCHQTSRWWVKLAAQIQQQWQTVQDGEAHCGPRQERRCATQNSTQHLSHGKRSVTTCFMTLIRMIYKLHDRAAQSDSLSRMHQPSSNARRCTTAGRDACSGASFDLRNCSSDEVDVLMPLLEPHAWCPTDKLPLGWCPLQLQRRKLQRQFMKASTARQARMLAHWFQSLFVTALQGNLGWQGFRLALRGLTAWTRHPRCHPGQLLLCLASG